MWRIFRNELIFLFVIQFLKNRQDFDDPDTPPSSPINLPGPNVLYDAIKSALVQPISNYFQAAKSSSTLVLAPTPPGTPQNELDEDYISSITQTQAEEETKQLANTPKESSESSQNFFEQLVNKLSLFSFRSVVPLVSSLPKTSLTPCTEQASKTIGREQGDLTVVHRPLAVYAKGSPKANWELIKEVQTESRCFILDWKINVWFKKILKSGKNSVQENEIEKSIFDLESIT